MAKPKKPAAKRGRKRQKKKTGGLRIWLRRWAFRGALLGVALALLAVLFYAVVNPSRTPYMAAEARRLGSVDRQWVNFEDISPMMIRSVVAAEDANFCNHWGFDMAAIRLAMAEGGGRGASTLSQQVVKNVYLWQGRSWPRKALEASLTPLVELIWTKRRILEVYLNVAEFDEGVFGVEAAARTYFRTDPGKLTQVQAARLAAMLPSPKTRSAAKPTDFVRRRAQAIIDGAATIRADGRASCFEG
ncbi:MAG: monofunctional biosynthetic peptidoglycan transglycosylase [Rhodobacteraceae bacterium]|nr:monofunctional biosynthetic peptidoglycan transglycosylase [Paracoccaceae bacterium]